MPMKAATIFVFHFAGDGVGTSALGKSLFSTGLGFGVGDLFDEGEVKPPTDF